MVGEVCEQVSTYTCCQPSDNICCLLDIVRSVTGMENVTTLGERWILEL